MGKIRVAIIGCGVMGAKHALAVDRHGDAELVALCDILPEAATKLAHQHPSARATFGMDELLKSVEFDLAILAIPTAARFEPAMKLLGAGKHLLLEKPMGMSVKQLLRMKESLSDGQVIAGCSSRFRLYESAEAARAFIASGELGELRILQCRCVRSAPSQPSQSPPPWRLSHGLNGGGILVNWGVYDLDYLMGITGWEFVPELALAGAWRTPDRLGAYEHPDSDAEAHLIGMIRCADGKVISFERGEFVAQSTDEVWNIIGDRGSLRLNMIPGQGKSLVAETLSESGELQRRILWQGDEDYGQVHLLPAGDLIEAMGDNRSPATDLDQSILLQAMIDAMYASVRLNRAITIQEVMR